LGVGVSGKEKPVEPESAQYQVSGFVMMVVEMASNAPSISGAPLMGILLVFCTISV